MTRLQCLQQNMIQANMDQIILSDPLSIYYLTGHYVEPDERFMALYITPVEVIFFVNHLFEQKDDQLHIVEFTDYDDEMELFCSYIQKGNLYVDKLFPAKYLIPILHTNKICSVEVTELVDELRMIKDQKEIDLMKESSRVNDCVMKKIKEYLREGVTEKEIEQKLLELYIKQGAQGFSFDPIVSFGKNTSDTHHTPDSTPLKKGECIMLDTGCKKDMYCSDMTRMYFYGYEPDEKQKYIFSLVQKAYYAGLKQCKPGVRLSDIDKACRKVIEDAGYGDCFKHRTGHMIGLETHDHGEVSKTSTLIAQKGMIFSIEPTIMLEDYTIHYENLVMITQDGYEVLNNISDKMLIIK